MSTYKGQITFNAEQCVVCKTCAFVCPANAISITCTQPQRFHDFIIWHNTCTLCGNCTYFCPTGAIALSSSPAKATPQHEKYTHVTANVVHYTQCTQCGENMTHIPQTLLERGFKEVDATLRALFDLCPKCRRDYTFEKRAL